MSNSTAKRTRPLSPNIQIYRPQLTSVLSIANRITGVVLSICAVVLVVWLIAAATGPQAYAAVQGAIASWIGQIVLFGCTFAFFLHLCGGIRHLVWDTGMDSSSGRSTSRDGRWWRRASRSPWRPGSPAYLCRIEPMDRQRMRSPLARALGLGSAKEGVEHWWMERVSAVALVPLTLWFVASIIAHTGSDYATFIAWLRTPLASILMILLLIALFYHTALGLQVVIEDYVHSGAKFAALIAVRLGCFALAAAGIVADLRIAFGG